MYSIPQQAVTNGYWKMEFFRAQPKASERLLSKKPMLSSRRVARTGIVFSSPPMRGDSGTLPSGLSRDVDQPERQRRHERQHLEVREPAQTFAVQVAQQRAPRVDEHAFDVEDDEEERDQVELHRVARVRVAGGRRAALEGGLLDGGDPLRPEHGREHADGGAERAGDQQQHEDRDVRREVVHRQGGGK